MHRKCILNIRRRCLSVWPAGWLAEELNKHKWRAIVSLILRQNIVKLQLWKCAAHKFQEPSLWRIREEFALRWKDDWLDGLEENIREPNGMAWHFIGISHPLQRLLLLSRQDNISKCNKFQVVTWTRERTRSQVKRRNLLVIIIIDRKARGITRMVNLSEFYSICHKFTQNTEIPKSPEPL